MRNERLSCSASASFATIPRKRSAEEGDLVAPARRAGSRRRSDRPRPARSPASSTRTGSVSRRESHRRGLPASATPTARASASRPSSVSHCSRSSASGFATTSQPNGSVPWTSCTGWAAAMQLPALAGRRELDDDLLVAIELDVAERAPREPREAEPLPREERRADVVELVARRELELLGRELRRLRALVRRARAPTRRRARRARTPRARAPSTDCSRVTSWKSRTASAIETSPNTRTTARKRAVRRNRSVPSMGCQGSPLARSTPACARTRPCSRRPTR